MAKLQLKFHTYITYTNDLEQDCSNSTANALNFNAEWHFDGSVQDCSISIANALEILLVLHQAIDK